MAQNSLQDFQYLPLETALQIRLLRLGRIDHGNKQGPEVVHFNLLDLPKFAALSYSWGKKAASSQLRMSNDQALRVSTTVLQAISRLESIQKYGYLWIDQVCINQQDTQERGHQVALMAEIYSKADEVFVWLGEDEHGLASRLKRMVDVYVPESRPGLHLCISRSDCADLLSTQGGRFLSGQGSAFGTREMSTVSEVLSRPWFRRAWVVQEVAVARTVTLLLGAHTLLLSDLDYLVSLTALTERETEDDSLSTTKLRYSTGFECFHRTIHQRRQYHAGMTYEGFLPFLCRVAGSYEATDPRDLIFAFLGLYRRDYGLLVEPDYAISTETVFSKAAKALVSQSNSLDLLSAITGTSSATSSAGFANRHRVIDDSNLELDQDAAVFDDPATSRHDPYTLPSWVPDWTLKLKNRPFRLGNNTPQFCASATFSHRPSASDPLGRLTVRGKAIARVESLHEATRPDHLGRGILAVRDQLPLDDLFSELRKGRAKTSPPLTLERILHVIIADGSSRREFASSIEAQKQRLTYLRIAELVSAWEVIGQLLGHENTAERIHEDARALQQHLKVAEGRCLISTEGVAALGLAPGHTRVGDVVCVLHGSRIPVILRESSENTYHVIGQCFLEGAMYGEAVTWEEAEADAFVLI